MKSKWTEGFWFLILTGLFLMLLELILSSRLSLLLHSRMHIFVYMATFFLGVLVLHQLWKIMQEGFKRKRFKWGLLIFLIPLILAAGRPSMMASEILENKQALIGTADASNRTIAQTTDSDTAYGSDTATDLNPGEAAQLLEDTDPFYTDIMSLQGDLTSYKGKTMKFVGFVFRKDNFSSSQIVVSRLLITCCASDAAVLGILCEDSSTDSQWKLEEFVNDSWVEVEGQIDSFSYKDPDTGTVFEVPLLKISSIKGVEPLDTPYVP